MNIKIDLKSALCALAVGVLAMFVIGAAGSSTNPIGRYQTAAGFGFFMTVDTATGQAWLANVATPGLRGIPADFFEKRVDKFAIGTTDSPSPIGRYQITGGSGFFMITDTATGQTWGANAAEPGSTGIQGGFFEKKVDK
ncbi:MAG: hypothetical protein IH623_12985 [Verrucomicrobia bacterium]|nr:hypothetical protein [Verrucomicrobiota bacterium]